MGKTTARRRRWGSVKAGRGRGHSVAASVRIEPMTTAVRIGCASLLREDGESRGDSGLAGRGADDAAVRANGRREEWEICRREGGAPKGSRLRIPPSGK